jgi:RHS repeat-associated protein
MTQSFPGGGFESPVVADYQYRPVDGAWTYGDSAGIAANGGTLTSESDDAPNGFQSGFIEKNGSLWHTFTLSPGTYTFAFQAAQAVSVNDSSQQARVTLLGLPTSAKTFVWSGNTIAEERDASGEIVTKRFFAEGEQRIGGDDAGNYYYSRDHLGSVREVTDASGVVKVQYDYDAWGNQVVAGNMSFDFGYTGHYRHAASNLYLAEYRAYDPALGRWLSRDPLDDAELRQGTNLYAYVHNMPGNSVDPDGRFAILIPLVPWLIEGIVGTGATIWLWNAGVDIYKDGERSREYHAYKTRCNQQPPPNLTDPCAIARWTLQRMRDCADMRERWANKWEGGATGTHLDQIVNNRRGADRLEERIRQNCPCPSK